jgi:hypothetical protein
LLALLDERRPLLALLDELRPLLALLDERRPLPELDFDFVDFVDFDDDFDLDVEPWLAITPPGELRRSPSRRPPPSCGLRAPRR